MDDCDLPVDDSMIGEGDFSCYVDEEVERVLDANPDADAFAFSNDEMASSCYRVCEKRGLRIGIDLKITGYDGGEFSDRMIPPLTTVFQDAYGMGYQAVEDMARILQGASLTDQRYPVQLITRESCGCPPKRSTQTLQPQQAADELRRVRKKAAKREQELLDYQSKSWYIPMMARDLNDCVQDETEYCYQVMEKLKLFKVNRLVYFYLQILIGCNYIIILLIHSCFYGIK